MSKGISEFHWLSKLWPVPPKRSALPSLFRAQQASASGHVLEESEEHFNGPPLRKCQAVEAVSGTERLILHVLRFSRLRNISLIYCHEIANFENIDLHLKTTMNLIREHFRRPIILAVVLLLPTATAVGQWSAQGPGPTLFGQVENIPGGDPVVGAMHTVAAHPTNANILFAGGTNGGLWRTENALDTDPNWLPLIDSQSSLSIGALEFDPLDLMANTLIAGNGRYSSYGRVGTGRDGLLLSSDGGDTWNRPAGNSALVGKNISGVVSRGSTIVASVNTADSFTFDNIGIFRSTDAGVSFTQISNGNGSASGLPGGSSYDLVGDPGDTNTLYTSVVFASDLGGQNGIYRSTDVGATWSKVSDPLIDTLVSGDTSNLELTVGGSGEVYAAVVNNGRADGIFRSDNGNPGTWVAMDLPVTNEDGTFVGLNPGGGKGPGPGSPADEIAGGQGTIHFSIRADPTNPNLVYVGGDRQPLTTFPNSIGAFDFSGRLFRGDASQPAGSQFVHLTHSDSLGAPGGGTASSSSPHADSREIVFDATGRLIEVDDGGIYYRSSPQDNTGDWFSLIGDIQTTELHDVAYDSLNNRLVGGAQDTGTPIQSNSGNTTWESISTADGGDVAVDVTTNPGHAIVYSSFQVLQVFRKTTFDSNGIVVDQEFPDLQTVSGPDMVAQFTTPVELNRVNPERILFGGSNGIYESLDQGETLSRISPVTVSATLRGNALTYGGFRDGVANPALVYGGTANGIFSRTTEGGPVSVVSGYSGRTVRDLIPNSTDWAELFALDSTSIYHSSDTTSGVAFANVTGNLASTDLWTVEFVDLPSAFDAVFVGGEGGVFYSTTDNLEDWTELGGDVLPNSLVFDLVYNAEDDILAAGTLGRGGWIFDRVTANILADLDRDGAVDCADVDLLVASIVGGSDPTPFDLNGDGSVDPTDLDSWLVHAGTLLTVSGNPILPGDANLDGSVDVSDFNIWNENKFSNTPAWCSGDFNADGSVDVSDFNVWNERNFESSDLATVPEPGGFLLLLVGLAIASARKRT